MLKALILMVFLLNPGILLSYSDDYQKSDQKSEEISSKWCDFKLFGLNELSIDAYRTKAKRDAYMPEYNGKWTNGAQFNLDLRLFEVFRWDNHIHLDSTQSQIRNVGWRFDIFMDYYRYIAPYYHHHSQHSLDNSEHAETRFPIEDEFGLRFIFYKNN